MTEQKEKVGLLIFTDGRFGLLDATIRSWEENFDAVIDKSILINDSPDPVVRGILDNRYGDKMDKIIHHDQRLGFGGTIKDTWENHLDDLDWIVHLEDDFMLVKPVALNDLLTILKLNSHLSQIVLMRQPWNEQEKKAGSVWGKYPERYTEMSMETNGRILRWMEHRVCWSTNPCVYHRSITELGWPDSPESEGKFGFRVREKYPDRACFAMFGSKSDSHYVYHTGTVRVGTGY